MSSDVWIDETAMIAAHEVSLVAEASSRLAPSPYFRWKYLMGRTIAAILLVPSSALIILAVIAVRVTSHGPGIYRQRRVGLNGRVFTMYKIRTMFHDAEVSTGAVWTQNGDPRITRLGRLIRNLHIDELPQLVNVIRGDMTLVGPRPERPEFTEKLAEEIPDYEDRLLVLPGITGLAQVNLPPDANVGDVRRKLVLDRQYVREGSFWLDLRIVMCTALRLVGIRGVVARWLSGVSREVTLGPRRAASKAKRSRNNGSAKPIPRRPR